MDNLESNSIILRVLSYLYLSEIYIYILLQHYASLLPESEPSSLYFMQFLIIVELWLIFKKYGLILVRNIQGIDITNQIGINKSIVGIYYSISIWCLLNILIRRILLRLKMS